MSEDKLFGKSTAHLANVPSFRAQAAGYQPNAPRRAGGSGGGGVPHFIGEFKPSKDEADKVRLIAGAYDVLMVDPNTEEVKTVTLPYWPTVEHRSQKTNRTAFCAAGPWRGRKGKSEPCLGCDVFWGEYNDFGKGDQGKTVNARALNVFTLIDYGLYFEIDSLDGSGRPRMNQQTNQPWTQWVKSTGRGDPNERIARNRKNGHVVHWALGKTHLEQLLAYEAETNKSCKNCGGQDTIQVLAYLCPHCSETVVDMGNTRMAKQDIDAMTLQATACPHCKNIGYMQPYLECTECTDAKQASLFDVDLKIRRVMTVGDGGREKSTLTMMGMSKPRPIDASLLDIAKPKPVDKIYGPTPFAKQQELLGMKAYVPQAERATAAQGPAARQWGDGGRVLAPPARQAPPADDFPADGTFDDDEIPFLSSLRYALLM
jgi:hypothetical protein